MRVDEVWTGSTKKKYLERKHGKEIPMKTE